MVNLVYKSESRIELSVHFKDFTVYVINVNRFLSQLTKI
jgi:hypothetical protein